MFCVTNTNGDGVVIMGNGEHRRGLGVSCAAEVMISDDYKVQPALQWMYIKYFILQINSVAGAFEG